MKMKNKKRRIFLTVLDSFGIGYMPDADKFSDVGANTLKTIYGSKYFKADTLRSLGLFNIDRVEVGTPVDHPLAAYARMAERSMGKDTITGHWEMCGIISEKPMPTYPDGFPEEILDKLRKATGREILCNKPYSGTEVIKDYGREHMETGALIVYTSADSVLQIAAHEDIVPVETLYGYCVKAREIMQGEHRVGRVIARPFTGTYPDFVRTPRRHDYAVAPPEPSLLDRMKEAGFDVISIGKIYDIFNGSGITRKISTKNNDDGLKMMSDVAGEDWNGLCFTNLCDFDMVYGHRNDIDGYAKALASFDEWLGEFIKGMKEDDLLMITGDHGCDPGYPTTDHTREYTPLLIYGAAHENLGTRSSFNFIGEYIWNSIT